MKVPKILTLIGASALMVGCATMGAKPEQRQYIEITQGGYILGNHLNSKGVPQELDFYHVYQSLQGVYESRLIEVEKMGIDGKYHKE